MAKSKEISTSETNLRPVLSQHFAPAFVLVPHQCYPQAPIHALTQDCSSHHKSLLQLSPPRELQLCLQARHQSGHRWQPARLDCITRLLPHLFLWPYQWCGLGVVTTPPSTCHFLAVICHLSQISWLFSAFPLSAPILIFQLLFCCTSQGFDIPADARVPRVLLCSETRVLLCLCSPNQMPPSTLLLHNGARQKEEGSCHAHFHL